MDHINLINMIESYITPWGRYRALAYYSPMGYKMLQLTKGVHVYTCMCSWLQVHLCALPQSCWGWCDDNHVRVRIGGKYKWATILLQQKVGFSEGWILRSLPVVVVLFQDHQSLPRILPPAPALPRRFYTPGWSTANKSTFDVCGYWYESKR